MIKSTAQIDNTCRLELLSLNLKLTNINGKLSRLTNSLLEGVITGDSYKEIEAKLLTDKVGLEAKIAAQSEKNGPSIQHIEKNLEPLKNIYWLYLLADKNKKRLLLKSISSNLLLTGGKIVITPKSPFDLLLNHNPLPHCDHS